MNPLTQVKRTQKINAAEAALGISEGGSWHAKYSDSAYIFVGGVPYDLTEGDLLAVFAQYGEIVDVNLVRDKATGKSKGFAFLAYEDQRSTILAVDNLNGAKVLDRIVRVDHAGNYKKKEEEDEEKEQQKREARGVCRAYQKGECNRGAACRFSHDEQRSANTGWGPKDSNTARGHGRYDGPPKSHKNYPKNSDLDAPQHRKREAEPKAKSDGRSSRAEEEGFNIDSHEKRGESSLKDRGRQGSEKVLERKSSGRESKEDLERQSGRNKSDRYEREDIDRRSRYDRDSSRRHREEDEKRQRRE